MRNNIFTGLNGWKKFGLAYLTLLIISHFIIGLFESPISEGDVAHKEVRLQTVLENSAQSEQLIEIEYQDIYRGKAPNPPILLMLPGGPEGPSVFNELIPKLTDDFRVVIPHLPGYGNTQKNLPDYSFQALALYTKQLLNKLKLKQVHLIGYGLGGASAIYLANDSPDRIASLSLVSSIGVQELELLGSYTLNHAVYGIQLAAVWLLHNAVPHFGLFDALDISVPYAMSYYESDQRPLRSYLENYRKPMLILHGINDPLVPLAVAQEHYRIVPQSTLKLFDADHDLVETHSGSVSRALTKFVLKVETGKVATIADASPERIEAAQKRFSNIEFAKFKGVSLLIIMLIIMLGTLISEDLTCIGAGLLAARGLIGFWPATVACFLGIFIGDVGLYGVGRFMGRPALRKAPFKWFITEADMDKSAKWFKVRGPAIIIASRFLPGSRFPTYFSAGLIQAGFWMFLSYFLLSAIIWTPLLVGISQLLGNELMRYLSVYREYTGWILLAAVFFLIVIAKLVIPAFSHRGRRLLLSRYRRIRHWQYWPSFLQFTPLFFYIIWLGLKYRCFTLFTATNCGIPGFFDESKSAMLDLFNPENTVCYQHLSSSPDDITMINRAREFMKREKLSFPVVLKPDKGKGGQDVGIVQNIYELQDYFFNSEVDVIIQEYIEGRECEIFYHQKPGESKGNIYSIAVKEFLKVVGNGEKTLEELILDDDRAVNLAKLYLRQNEGYRYNIPDEGECISIVKVGTYPNGIVFKNGEKFITGKLEKKVNEIANSATGFFFGCFNIRVLSTGNLKEGEGLKVIDVNGATYLPKAIYDLNCSYWQAQKILRNQWKRAFQIGKKNRKNGAEVIPLSLFLKQFLIRLFK